MISDVQEALSHPVCDLALRNIKNKDLKYVYRLTALEDGGALVYNDTGSQCQVVRVDREGHTLPPVYTCKQYSYIIGILTYNEHIYILQDNLSITKYNMNEVSNRPVTYKVDVGDLEAGTLIESNQLLLPDYKHNEVIVFNTDDQSKQVVITDVRSPVSVACNQDHSVIAVCELRGHCVSLYDRSYVKQATIGSYGESDGCLDGPYCVLFTPSGSLLVADTNNNRVCEFSQQGAFIRHIIKPHHGIHQPLSLSYRHPHLWVACHDGKTVKRFKIYK